MNMESRLLTGLTARGVQIDGSWSLYMGIEMILHKTTFERRGIQMGMPTKADINQYTFDQVDISNIYI